MGINRVAIARQVIMRWPSLVLAALFCLNAACAGRRGTVHASLRAAGERDSALAVADALEALIDAGQDTLADREYAYQTVHAQQEDTAASTFACATVTGRLVQQKGLRAAKLVPEIERCARRSRELDPDFRAGAATRLLGTLYVIAPATLVQHGDSELGVDLLETLVETHPDGLENHLRLAEAYIALGDPAPAAPHLCQCVAHERALRADDQRLLRRLLDNARLPPCPQSPTAAGGSPPAGRGTRSTTPPEVP